jgi:hypothetical protein
MIKPQNFVISIDVYHRVVMVFINQSAEEITSFFKENCPYVDDEYLDHATRDLPTGDSGDTWRDGNGDVIIRISMDEDNMPRLHSIVGHEVFHAAEKMLGFAGMKLTKSSSEAYAYLIGYITREFYSQADLKPFTEPVV